MTDWTRINYPEQGKIVWLVTDYGDVELGYWDGETWQEPDGTTWYQTVVAWAEIDYDSVKQSWNKA